MAIGAPTNLVPAVDSPTEAEVAYTPPADELGEDVIATQVGATWGTSPTTINVIPGRGYYWTRGANETSIESLPITTTYSTTADFLVPAVGATVDIAVTSFAGMTAGLPIYVHDKRYTVIVINGLTVTARNDTDTPGATIVSGAPVNIPIISPTTPVYWETSIGTMRIVHANGAAVTATLKEVRVQTYRLWREGTIGMEITGIKQKFTDTDLTERRFLRYRVEAISSFGDTGLSAVAFAATPPVTPGFPIIMGTPGAGDSVQTMGIDASGNLIMVGKVPRAGISPQGMVISKFDSSGQLLWAKFIHSTGSVNTSNALFIKSNGDIVYGFTFSGTINVGGSNLVASAGSAGNICIAAFSAAGAHQWSFSILPHREPNPVGSINAKDSESITSLEVDGSGNIYLAGSTNAGCGSSCGQYWDFYHWYESYDSSQVLRWHKNVGSTFGGLTYTSLVFSGATLWLVAGCLGSITISGAGTFIPNGTGTPRQSFVLAKLATATGEATSSLLVGTRVTANATIADGSGGLLVCGRAVVSTNDPYNVQNPNAGGPEFTDVAIGGSAFVARYDSNAAHLWSANIKSGNGSAAFRLHRNGNNVAFCGYFVARAIWAGTLYFSNPGNFVSLSNNGYVARITMDGVEGAFLPHHPSWTVSQVFDVKLTADSLFYLVPNEADAYTYDMSIVKVAL